MRVLFLLCVSFALLSNEKNVIFLYNGPGVSQGSLAQTERSIQKALPAYTVERISSDRVISDSWEKRAALFILPGGADLLYVTALEGPGNRKIRAYVEGGGAFLGICAGSYYAGNFVDFASGSALEIKGDRELAFFPGTVQGPILAPYDYLSESGARAAKLRWSGKEGFKPGKPFTIFYNGGGCFVGASEHATISVLACYEGPEPLPAIIECQVGQGKAILSGPHFEYDPLTLDTENPYLKTLVRDLVQENKSRIDLLEYLLRRLVSL